MRIFHFGSGALPAALLTGLAILATTSSTAVAQDDSTTTTVRTIESRVLGQDLVLDDNDYPVLAYQHVTTRGIRSLKVARCTDAICDGVMISLLANLGPGTERTPYAIGSITIMLDKNDFPVVGFTQEKQLRVARCLDRLCQRFSMENIGVGREGQFTKREGQSATFALDQNDLVVAAHTTDAVEGDASVPAIDVIRCSNKRCSASTTTRIATLEPQSSTAWEYNGRLAQYRWQRPALAIGSDNNPVLGYVYESQDGVLAGLLAKCVDVDCNVVNKTIIAEGLAISPLSVALDNSGNPIAMMRGYDPDARGYADVQLYIACLDADCNDRLERSLATRWESNLVPATLRTLAIADNGSVTIVVNGEADGTIVPELFYCETVSCDTFEYRGTVASYDSYGLADTDLALAVDKAGEPVVAFQERGLKVASCGSQPCTEESFFQNGTYRLQNLLTNNYLSVDDDLNVITASEPGLDEIWDINVELNGSRDYRTTVRHVQTNRFLYLRSPGLRPLGFEIEYPKLSQENPERPNYWDPIFSVERGYGFLTRPSKPRDNTYALGIDPEDSTTVIGIWYGFRNPENRWRFLLTSAKPNELVGKRIALQNMITGRWLDNDLDGAVNQSANLSDDDIWLVQDAGGGYVYLVNEHTGQYLDADPKTLNLDSSSTRTQDNSWELRFAGDKLTLRSTEYDGYVTAQGWRNQFNSIRQSGASLSAYWTPRIIQ